MGDDWILSYTNLASNDMPTLPGGGGGEAVKVFNQCTGNYVKLHYINSPSIIPTARNPPIGSIYFSLVIVRALIQSC